MKPETLLEKAFRLNERQLKALHHLGLQTVKDLLYHLPSRYVVVSGAKPINALEEGDAVVLYGTLEKLKSSKAFRKKIPMATAKLQDETGSIDVVWFNQPYIAHMVPAGSYVKLEGRVQKRKDDLYLANPEFEVLQVLPEQPGESLFADTNQIDLDQFILTVYPESRGITSKWFSHTIQKILKQGIHLEIPDPIPEAITTDLRLPSLADSFVLIHQPKDAKDAEVARKRFAFEEIFILQTANAQERIELQETPAYRINKTYRDLTPFLSSLGFTPTTAQRQAIKAILSDISKSFPMSRLLEGDVGSGKTAVAAAISYTTAHSSPASAPHERLQVAFMAPTEILARQHYESLITLFKNTDLQIGLLTGGGAQKYPAKVDPESPTPISKVQLKKWVKNGEIEILVGTHALIQKTVEFKHLALVIIDEQHRFGVRQRLQLTRKDGPLPHLLSMTATPIPRTLALTLYGNLDLTVVDEMPPGRKPVITELIDPTQREYAYSYIRKEIANGRQAYVICPRIEEADPNKKFKLDLRAVTTEAARLRKDIFPTLRIAELHGKMSANQKDKIMNQFLDKEFDILVATSVVEVGVNVPNATTIIIEDAERFGLSQLHQLRGRVLRSTHQARCFLFTESSNEKTHERLKLFEASSSGLELAEMDLRRRGPGELIGNRQSGLSDTAMEALRNLKMVEVAQQKAQDIIEEDPSLQNFSTLQERVSAVRKKLHLE